MGKNLIPTLSQIALPTVRDKGTHTCLHSTSHISTWMFLASGNVLTQYRSAPHTRHTFTQLEAKGDHECCGRCPERGDDQADVSIGRSRSIKWSPAPEGGRRYPTQKAGALSKKLMSSLTLATHMDHTPIWCAHTASP